MAQSAIEHPPFLPYGRQHVTREDIAAVVRVLESDWLTQGPNIEALEGALANQLGAREVVVCSNGTAALHLAIMALGLGAGDSGVTSPITFVATANCLSYVGSSVQFADVDEATAIMDPSSLEDVLAADKDRKIKVVLPVHFAGQAADLQSISELARNHGAHVVDDACHALGGEYEYEGKRRKIGDGFVSDFTAFSFHPVKHIATGEGGALATNDVELAARARRLRSHGIQRENFENHELAYDSDGHPNPWYQELNELGYNYRISDLQAVLGISQLSRLKDSIQKRNHIADAYDRLIATAFDPSEVTALKCAGTVTHAYHLYVLQVDFKRFNVERSVVMGRLREQRIGTQVHYIPVHLQPYYRRHSHSAPGDHPRAEQYYGQALSIPMYPQLSDTDCERVVQALEGALTNRP